MSAYWTGQSQWFQAWQVPRGVLGHAGGWTAAWPLDSRGPVCSVRCGCQPASSATLPCGLRGLRECQPGPRPRRALSQPVFWARLRLPLVWRLRVNGVNGFPAGHNCGSLLWSPSSPRVGRRTRWPCAACCGEPGKALRAGRVRGCGRCRTPWGWGEGRAGCSKRPPCLDDFHAHLWLLPNTRESRAWPGPQRRLDMLLREKVSGPVGQGLQELTWNVGGAAPAGRVFGGGRADLGPGVSTSGGWQVVDDGRPLTGGSGRGGDKSSVRGSQEGAFARWWGERSGEGGLSHFSEALLGPAAALVQGQLAKLFPDPRATRAACHIHS